MNRTNKGMVLLAALLLAVLIGYPVFIIIIRSFTLDGALNLENYKEAFFDSSNYKALMHSLIVSASSTVLATIIGCGAAYFTVRTDMAFKKLVHSLFLFNFFIPPFIMAMAWRQILGPVGTVNKLYQALTGSTDTIINIYGQGGIILVFTLSSSAMVYMVMRSNFEKIQSSLEEAAVITGASPFQIFKDIVMPVLKPSIFSAMILVFVANMSNYGVPSVLGFHVSYYTLTTRIRQVLEDFSMANNMEVAASLSTVLVIITVLTLTAKDRMLKGKEFTLITGKSEKAAPNELGRWRIPMGIVWSLYGMAISFCPILSILATSLTKAYGLPFSIENFSLKNYATVLNMPLFQRAMQNSLFLAFTAAFISVAIGFLVAYLCVMARSKASGILEFVISMPAAIPGTVMAIAIILAWLRPIPVLGFSIYNTIWIILIAYVANYTTQAFRSISGSMYQINRSLEEAAVISGAELPKIMTSIVIPLIKESIGTSWFLIFIPCLRELTLSIFLWSSGNETLATAIFTLQDAGNYTASCALSVLIIAMIAAVNIFVGKVFHIKGTVG